MRAGVVNVTLRCDVPASAVCPTQVRVLDTGGERLADRLLRLRAGKNLVRITIPPRERDRVLGVALMVGEIEGSYRRLAPVS
jgi:hypothetical protein